MVPHAVSEPQTQEETSMSPFDIISLLGGLALFLYGMRVMGDGLKSGSSGALKAVMERVTNNPVKAFLLGLAVTAVIQSSTATIVITSGLVAAGILSLHQSLGIIVGANVGTTVTGQIIRLLDLDASGTSFLQFFKPSTLAPIALILGIVLIMGFKKKNSQTAGNVAIGFGILFTGLLNMTGAVDALTSSGALEGLISGIGNNHFLGYTVGAAVSFVLQSSSASVGILQAFSQSGLLTFNAVYVIIVGIYLGDCLTTWIVCSIGARAEQKRVGVVNVLYNLMKSALVLIVVAIIHRIGLLNSLWDAVVDSGIIANTNTVFNLVCAIALLPMLGMFERGSKRLVKDDKAPVSRYREKLEALNTAFFDTPALALGSCYDILKTTFTVSRENLRRAFGLLNRFDQKVMEQINADEADVDLMTDEASKYMVNVLPHLAEEGHVAILNQYYRDVTEFERLGDSAVDIAEAAQDMAEQRLALSPAAKAEMAVMEELTERIIENAWMGFEKRDVEAAYRVLPMEEVADEFLDALKENHLQRMSRGECNVLVDSYFTNLLADLKRIAGICANVAVATIVRVSPELANEKHTYFVSLRSGQDEAFNASYAQVRGEFFEKLASVKQSEERAAAGAGALPGSGGVLTITPEQAMAPYDDVEEMLDMQRIAPPDEGSAV